MAVMGGGAEAAGVRVLAGVAALRVPEVCGLKSSSSILLPNFVIRFVKSTVHNS